MRCITNTMKACLFIIKDVYRKLQLQVGQDTALPQSDAQEWQKVSEKMAAFSDNIHKLCQIFHFKTLLGRQS